MTLNNNELITLLNQTQSEDFLKNLLLVALKSVMETDVSNLINADKNERSSDRKTYRNGYRTRGLNTRVGSLSLEIPKLRNGIYYPSFLSYYQRTEQALLSVIQESYILGVSTRKMEDVIQQMGVEGISKSQVSEICTTIKNEVDAYFSSPISGFWPYIYLDAAYIKSRQDKVIVSKAVIVAIGVNALGERRVLGLEVSDSESSIFWEKFLNKLIDRGLKGVQLVVSDAHKGLKEAIQKTFLGSSWQRCWVHFMRNVLAHTSKKNCDEVVELMRSIRDFKSTDGRKKRWREVITIFEERYPKIAEMMIEAEDDVLAHTAFPTQHWDKIYSNNPIERLNREIKRRINSVGIFPNNEAAIRLIGAVLIHWDEEWINSTPYFTQNSMKALHKKD